MAKKDQVDNRLPPAEVVRIVDRAVDGGDDTELKAYLANLNRQDPRQDEEWSEPEAAG